MSKPTQDPAIRSSQNARDTDRATLRNVARPFGFYAAVPRALAGPRQEAARSPKPRASQEVAPVPRELSIVPRAAEPARATLRDMAQPFHFPVELIDRDNFQARPRPPHGPAGPASQETGDRG